MSCHSGDRDAAAPKSNWESQLHLVNRAERGERQCRVLFLGDVATILSFPNARGNSFLKFRPHTHAADKKSPRNRGNRPRRYGKYQVDTDKLPRPTDIRKCELE